MRVPRAVDPLVRAGLLVRRVVDGLLAVVLAPPCGACGVPLATPTAGPVCETCWLAIRPYTPPVCPECGAPVASWRTLDSRADCKRLPPRIARARSLGEYDGALRDIIHVLKYGRRRSLGPRLAALMRQQGADVLEGADAAVPVPLHRTRSRRRGFNQAADLARCLGLPVLDALRRSRPTHVQNECGGEPAPRERPGRVRAGVAGARLRARGPNARAGGRRLDDGRGHSRPVHAYSPGPGPASCERSRRLE